MKTVLIAALIAIGPATAHAQQTMSATEAFAHLKALAGSWEAATTDEQNRPVKAPVTYEVVSGGTTVLERIVEGKSDMVTAFHVDGDKLILTHYCSAGNQPRMVARSIDGRTVQFDFVDATNLPSPAAGHIHSASFRFDDANHVVSEWTYFENGKAAGTVVRKQTRLTSAAKPAR
jgi:hypothetical protein